MATTDFSQVSFNDGEPLDLDKLRQLSQNITATYTKANSVYSALKNGNKGDTASIPVMDGGRVDFTSLAVGINGPKSVNFTMNLSNPTLVATISTNLGKTQAVPYITVDGNNKYSIYVNSSAAVSTTVSVNWIAFSPKIIPV